MMMTRSILMICLLLWLILTVFCCWLVVQPPCLPSSARPSAKEADGLSVAVTRQCCTLGHKVD